MAQLTTFFRRSPIPEPGRVIVYTPPNAVAVLGAEGHLDGRDARPGFRCRVAELFE